jgi:hypothetical protein
MRPIPVKYQRRTDSNAIKRHRRTANNWEELVGQRLSGQIQTNIEIVRENQSIQAVGRDFDYPIDEQAHDGIY